MAVVEIEEWKRFKCQGICLQVRIVQKGSVPRGFFKVLISRKLKFGWTFCRVSVDIFKSGIKDLDRIFMFCWDREFENPAYFKVLEEKNE